MKAIIIFAILFSSCASAKHYDYKAEGKKPVTYKKAHKYEHNLLKVAVVSFFFGYFVVSNSEK